MRFKVILSDPPWDYKTYSPNGRHKSPDNHYPCQGLDWIKSLPVASVSDKNSVLLLWATNPLLDQAFEVIEAWGFTYKSKVEWVKLTKSGKPVTATGYHSRSCTEPLLIATKGAPGAPAPSDRLPGVILAERGPHSRKPWLQYDYAEAYGLSPLLEMFARPIPGRVFSRPNWIQVGNEITGRSMEYDLEDLANDCLPPNTSYACQQIPRSRSEFQLSLY